MSLPQDEEGDESTEIAVAGMAAAEQEETLTREWSSRPWYEDRPNALAQNTVSHRVLNSLDKNPWDGCHECRGTPQSFQVYCGAVEDARDRFKANSACNHNLATGAVDWTSFYILPDLSGVTKMRSETIGSHELVSWYRQKARPLTPLLLLLWLLSC